MTSMSKGKKIDTHFTDVPLGYKKNGVRIIKAYIIFQKEMKMTEPRGRNIGTKKRRVTKVNGIDGIVT